MPPHTYATFTHIDRGLVHAGRGRFIFSTLLAQVRSIGTKHPRRPQLCYRLLPGPPRPVKGILAQSLRSVPTSVDMMHPTMISLRIMKPHPVVITKSPVIPAVFCAVMKKTRLHTSKASWACSVLFVPTRQCVMEMPYFSVSHAAVPYMTPIVMSVKSVLPPSTAVTVGLVTPTVSSVTTNLVHFSSAESVLPPSSAVAVELVTPTVISVTTNPVQLSSAESASASVHDSFKTKALVVQGRKGPTSGPAKNKRTLFEWEVR